MVLPYIPIAGALIMYSDYDEVIMENVFYQALIQNYRDLFLRCVTEGCILCVPRASSVSKFMLTLEDFCAHILVPSLELPESHFLNINGEEVRICNGVVSVEHNVGHQSNIHILFEETFYTSDLRYKVLCLEKPIEAKNTGSKDADGITILRTLKECMDFLWVESGSSDVIEKLNQLTTEFVRGNHDLDNSDLQKIVELTNELYVKCMRCIFKYPKIRGRVETDKSLVSNLKIAVETCMQHNIYNKIIKGISACTASKDAFLNKILRNLSNLQIQELDIRHELYEAVHIAKFELCKIDGYSTVLGKTGCLKKMFSALSHHSNDNKVIAADDVLQILIFLIIKIGLSNWNAQLLYLKYFRFSSPSQVQDEICFLITSFEAALKHIQSDAMVDGINPGITEINGISEETVKSLQAQYKGDGLGLLHNFFKSISLGNLEEVKAFIQKDLNNGNDSYLEMCHPLCCCSKCRALTSKDGDKSFSVNSCDGKGLTPLHIASMYYKSSIVEYLLSNGADPNKTDFNGLSAMHYAAMRGHQNGLLLIAYGGGDVNLPDFSSNTPLHYCSNNGHENCVKALVYFCETSGIKLNINTQNSAGDTPLHKASRWGYLNIVNLLLEHGADATIRNKNKLSPIDVAHNPKILELLTKPCGRIQNYVRVVPFKPMLDHQEEVQRDTPDRQSCKGVVPGSIDQLKKLDKILKAISDDDSHLACFYLGLDIRELETETNFQLSDKTLAAKCHPLCRCSNCETSSSDDNQEETKANGVKTDRMNVNICNTEGYTPLHMTAIHGKVDLCKLLIQNGAILNVQTRTQLFTPLMLACQQERIEVAKILLKFGCNIDMQDREGNTALHHATRTRNTKLVSALIEHDPDINIKNHKNKTALQEATENMFVGVLKAMKSDNTFRLKN